MTLAIRNLEFDLSAVPRHWHGGRRAVTAFFDNLSVFFPAGERFFIASVNAHRRHVKDAALLADMRGFSAQEGLHTREHIRYNQLLATQGYPVAAMEGRVERLLGWVSRWAPRRWQLGATCALEHFTALLAHMLLEGDHELAGADPAMAALWRWHAAEENEHKAVAYDVFLAAGGSYAERAGTMAIATVIFWGKVLEQQLRFMHHDGTLWSAREWADLVRWLAADPGPLRRLIRPYLAYYRAGFHPGQLDSSDLIARWEQAQQGASVRPGWASPS